MNIITLEHQWNGKLAIKCGDVTLMDWEIGPWEDVEDQKKALINRFGERLAELL